MTAGRLRALVLLFVTAGIFLPLATVALKYAADDFRIWNELREADPRVADLCRRYPFLDVSRSMPWLADLSWHHPWGVGAVMRGLRQRYLRIAASNAIVLVALLLFRKRVLHICRHVVDWLHVREHSGPRRIVFAFGLTILGSYLTHTPLGFWYPGIGGWNYEDVAARLDDTPPASAEERALVPTFVRKAIRPENAVYLPGPGRLVDHAMFLHFKGGEVLPGSYELLELVFPHVVFGPAHARVDRPEVFARVVRNSLSYRRRGARFLLPDGIGYPNHSAYAYIDYTGYPPAEELERISFWTLEVRIDEAGSAFVERAREDLTIGA